MAANDTLIIDFTNYKDRVGSRVTPGRYRVVVEDCELDKSNAGNQMINLWLRVTQGEFEGATIVDRLVHTEKSLFRIVSFMQALGLPTPKKRIQINLAAFRGKVLDVDVEDGEPYNKRVKSEVRGYLRIPADERSSATDVADVPDVPDVSTVDNPPTPSGSPVAVDDPAEQEMRAREVTPAAGDTDDFDLDELNLG